MNRIDDLNRSERYFTATILPYFLAFNSFKHMEEFISSLDGPHPPTLDELNSVELISEVDFIRDLRKWAEIQGQSDLHSKYESLLRDKGRLAVPDVMIKFGKTIVVVEGKFFQKRRAAYYQEQVSLQRELIELISEEFPSISAFHVFLTADASLHEIPGVDKVIYWQREIMNLATKMADRYPEHTELVYFKERLENAIDRYEMEFEQPSQGTDRSGTMRFYELGELLEFLMAEKDEYYIGFTGGIQELMKLTLMEAQQRSYWQVNKTELSKRNWISRGVFLDAFGVGGSLLQESTGK